MHMLTIVGIVVIPTAIIGFFLLGSYLEDRSRDNYSEWLFGMSLVGGSIAFIMLFILGGFAVAHNGCITSGRHMGLDTEYSNVSGCFVEIDGETRPLDLVEVIDGKLIVEMADE